MLFVQILTESSRENIRVKSKGVFCVAVCMSSTELWPVWKCVDVRDVYTPVHSHIHINTLCSVGLIIPLQHRTAHYATKAKQQSASSRDLSV